MRATGAANAAATRPVVPTGNNVGTAADGALASGNAFPPSDAQPAPDDQSSTAANDGQDNDFLLESTLALLLGLGLAGAAILAFRSRRRRGNRAEPAPVPNVSPAAMAAPVRSSAPMAAPAAPVPSPARATPVTHSGEDRQTTLERMVAAAPDKDNPFNSRKARRRRARILLQHRQQLQQAQEERFDWRTYSSGKRSAAPSSHAMPETAKV